MIQLVERGFFRPTAIKLSSINAGPASISPEVQVLRVGKFNHQKYGEFEITPITLTELKQNFDAKIRGVDIAIDYFHKSDEEAAGWIKELYLSEGSLELWARVDWTGEATKKLAEREIRYFSPDFAFQWTDPETNKTYRNVLFGGGLTNRPFVKDMAAIVASETKGAKKMDEKQFIELKALVLKLSEDNADMKKKMEADQLATKKHLEKLAPAAPVAPVKADEVPPPAAADGDEEEDMPTMKAKMAEMKKKLAEYEEKAKKLEEAKQMAEKESSFTVLLTEGKACVAQKDAFMKGDMASFVKLSQPLNMQGRGSASNGGTETGDREDRVMKLAEEKCKADSKLSKIDAISIANKEVK